ncbi:bucentaur or craniofacial development-domain-containing protein [Mycena belliarum]|uniref:SWR1-complex protein 5 n=1 Tax=Mycena belliarum TaxID=1033014 RepID=A0AAD6U3G2_9AGAR|nr:bucentaur or craniofacial development-domain-containing protein [Mycena belliae]
MSAVPNNASESEDDSDFVPPAGGDESESDGDEPALKRARTGSPKATAEEEGVKKQTREALWSTFQASVDEPHSKPVEKPKRMVKIEKRYLFAGEYTVEVVEVPEDSPDAKKWPLWRPPDDPAASSPAPGTQDSPSLSPGASTSSTRPAAKKPGPRKPRTSLADIPSQKARKLSTLDKSSMDWRAHVNSESPDIKDELDANRRGGGYLEKVEFLNRVDARKGDALELSKSTKRRR